LSNLVKRLPDVYNKDSDKNNYKLLTMTSVDLDNLKNEINAIQDTRIIDKAYGQNLDRIGENIKQERGPLNDKIYRILLKARTKINLSSGTINEIIEILATIFDINNDQVKIEEPHWGTFHFSRKYDEPEYDSEYGFGKGTLATDRKDVARLMIYIPPEAINSIGFSRQWFLELIEKIAAGGVKVDLGWKGTFKFSDTYDQPEYDTDKGFGNGTLGAYYDPPEQTPLPL